MACDSPERWTWGGIPDGSVFEVGLQSDVQDYNLTAVLYYAEGNDPADEEEWEREELDPGPKRKTLRSPRVYRLEITVRYPPDSEGDVSVRARVLENGNEFGTPYCRVLERKENDLHRVRLSLLTVLENDSEDTDTEPDS